MTKSLKKVFLPLSVFLIFGCNKSSNSLKPFSEELEFRTFVQYNGTTVLNVEVLQNMVVGPDSLSLRIHNPLSFDLSNVELLYFTNEGIGFDSVMTHYDLISLPFLLAGQDTVISLFTYPELPIEENEFNLSLLKCDQFENSLLFGKFNGQVEFLSHIDSIPINYAFVKGYISADGKTSFWTQLFDETKTIHGQFIDTLSLNALYTPNISNQDAQFQINFVEDSLGKRFSLGENQLTLNLRMSPIPNSNYEALRLRLLK